jgi:hypothetical protein
MWDNCLSVNDLIKACAQLRITQKSLFMSGDKLETSCERPRHLTKHTALGPTLRTLSIEALLIKDLLGKTSKALCYKTLHCRDLQMLVTTKDFVNGKTFKPNLMFVGKGINLHT